MPQLLFSNIKKFTNVEETCKCGSNKFSLKYVRGTNWPHCNSLIAISLSALVYLLSVPAGNQTPALSPTLPHPSLSYLVSDPPSKATSLHRHLLHMSQDTATLQGHAPAPLWHPTHPRPWQCHPHPRILPVLPHHYDSGIELFGKCKEGQGKTMEGKEEDPLWWLKGRILGGWVLYGVLSEGNDLQTCK